MQVRSQRFRHLGGTPQFYRLADDPSPCCDDMRQALNDEAVVFGDRAFASTNTWNTLCLVRCWPWPDDPNPVGRTFLSYHPIAFCPFCGEAIIITTMKEVGLA
jgi:hypothetical protein